MIISLFCISVHNWLKIFLYLLPDLEPDVANLDDSFDEKLALAAWNRKEFLGKYI